MREHSALGVVVLWLVGVGLLSCGAPAAPVALATSTPGLAAASTPEPWKLTATAETTSRSAVAEPGAAAVVAAATQRVLVADAAAPVTLPAIAADGQPAPAGAVIPAATPRLSGCGGAIAQVQQFRPADAKAPLDEILTNTLAATRASGTPVDVDGWSVAGAPPQCAVGFRYRQNGAPINLRWQVDGVTGQVKPADEVTRQTSGF